MKQIFQLFFLLAITPAFAQSVDENRLLEIVSNRNKTELAKNDSILLAVYSRADDAGKKQLLYFFSNNANSSDPYTAARCLLWKGVILSRPPFNNYNEPFGLMQQSISRAVESGDEYLMMQCFEIFAFNCTSMGRPETALFYFLKAAEIRKNVNDVFFKIKNPGLFGTIGDLLYKMQEYEQAIQYITLAMNDPFTPPNMHAVSMNTMGLAFQRLGKSDSVTTYRYCHFHRR